MSLIDDAIVIKDEQTEGANTADRVGGLLEAMLQNQPLMGFFDYNHSAAGIAYVTGDLVLPNDGLGPNTLKDYRPEGVTEIWDTVNNQFDWTSLSLGDTVDIRADISVTTTAQNQSFELDLRMAEGTGSEYFIPLIADKQVRTAGLHRQVQFNSIYIGNELTRVNPAKMVFRSDSAATVQVNGWYVRILKKSKPTA